jgi:hypothetical protein
MSCWTKEYTLGDTKDAPKSPESLLCRLALTTNDDWEYAAINGVSLFHSSKEFLETLNKLDHVVYLPLYLYDHSGITMNTTGYSHCDSQGWDWGWVGVIYITKEQIKKEYGWKVLTAARIEKIKKYLRGEVETYDQYLTGDVYYYTTVDSNGNNVDSCGGYFGHDHEKSGLLEAARGSIDYEIASKNKQKSKKLKALIKAKAPINVRETALAV